MGTVIGVMARAPAAGRCKTRLAASFGALGAAQLYEAMLRDSLDAYARAGATRTVVLAAPENDGARLLRAIAGPSWEIVPQVGDSLGERLRNAAETLGAREDAVVLASSDSPTVPIEPLARALPSLAQPRRVLLGPCDDGGYYAIGLSTLELGVFERISWSTSRVLEETRARCAEHGLAVTELPQVYDVDEPEDAVRLERDVMSSPRRAPHVAAFFAARRAADHR